MEIIQKNVRVFLIEASPFDDENEAIIGSLEKFPRSKKNKYNKFFFSLLKGENAKKAKEAGTNNKNKNKPYFLAAFNEKGDIVKTKF